VDNGLIVSMLLFSAQNECLQIATLLKATLRSLLRCCLRSYSVSKTSRTNSNELLHHCIVLM